MDSNAFDFFESILNTPGPSGYEQKIQQIVKDYAQGFASEITTDVHGNVIACVNPTAEIRIMFAGHCDQIGMLVSHIDSDGFIYAQTIGGWDPQQLVGQRMVIWSESGPIPAVISRKPIHLLEPEERKRVVKIEDLWLDIGASSKAEVEELICIGDAVTLKPGFQRMRNNCANAPGMDDRAGVWVVMEALRRCSANQLNCAVYAVSTVQEEIGLRGAKTSAFSIDPHVGIAVDVTHATDCPTIDKRQNGEISLGKGPVVFRGPNANPRVVERLVNAADTKDIPFQYSAIGRATSNDANQIQINRGGVAAGVVAIPNRYMHSAVETISLDDIDHAADLLAEFVTSIEPNADFTP
ncbi:M42 family metallopeptidase [Planctomycetota bacterium]